jgi:hypothetical protein
MYRYALSFSFLAGYKIYIFLGHYSIDCILAYYVTTRYDVFSYYPLTKCIFVRQPIFLEQYLHTHTHSLNTASYFWPLILLSRYSPVIQDRIALLKVTVFVSATAYTHTQLRPTAVLRIRIQGSGAFLTPGSGIWNRFFPEPGHWIMDPGIPKHIFESLMTIFWVKISLLFCKLAQCFFFLHQFKN